MEKITYVNELGNSIEFSATSAFILEKAEGLTGLHNNITSIKSMGQDGISIIGSGLKERNIVIQGSIIKDPETNKEKLISVLNPKIKGFLVHNVDGKRRKIDCEIEQLPSITKVPYLKFLVSFLCPNPYWQDVNTTKEEVAIWRGSFEFPLEIPPKGIEMGYREPSLIANIFNRGDVPCGIDIHFKALATVVNPRLINVNSGEYVKINRTMAVGEVITVITEFGNKRVELDKNGMKSNVFNWLDLNSTFLQLDVGINLFRYDADEGLDNLEVDIYYNPQYLGV